MGLLPSPPLLRQHSLWMAPKEMFEKHPMAVADDSQENSGNGNGISHLQDNFDGDSTSIKKVPNKPQRPPVNQSVSMIADDRIEILR